MRPGDITGFAQIRLLKDLNNVFCSRLSVDANDQVETTFNDCEMQHAGRGATTWGQKSLVTLSWDSCLGPVPGATSGIPHECKRRVCYYVPMFPSYLFTCLLHVTVTNKSERAR